LFDVRTETAVPDAQPSVHTVGQIGEDPLVADVISRYPGADWLTVGPGDDAAVLDLSVRFPGPIVVCTDTLVESQDFRRDWSTARDVGIKLAAQNFADVAAMGARPHTLLVSLTTPADVPAAWVRELADGLAAECARAGAVMAGGDLSGGTELSVTGTALGALSAPQAVLRSGARPGDIIAIAGSTGRSAAGWALLIEGHGVLTPAGSPAASVAGSAALLPALAGLVDDHRRPRPPYQAGPEAALAGATAMIDTSDGLVRDAERLARASGVILDLDPDALKADADQLAAAAFLGEPDPVGWVLSGGEDHALLACFPSDALLPASFRRIGTVRPAVAPGTDTAAPQAAAPSADAVGLSADAAASSAEAAAPSAEAGLVAAFGVGSVLLAGEPIPGPGGWRHFA
jgi:thiamine-monophosphate kinase